jgi:TPR repeat protein
VGSFAQNLKIVADQGIVAAQYNYGNCLHEGEGVGIGIDFRGAAHYFKLAANQGDAVAQYNYGICLHSGEGVEIDFAGAAHYFKLAADQGNASARFNDGICLRDAQGISVDLICRSKIPPCSKRLCSVAVRWQRRFKRRGCRPALF